MLIDDSCIVDQLVDHQTYNLSVASSNLADNHLSQERLLSPLVARQAFLSSHKWLRDAVEVSCIVCKTRGYRFESYPPCLKGGSSIG